MSARFAVRKAVFPVAGLGTRFLPATKAVPKEMLPVVDRPLIQYAVAEAIEAGVDTLIFVTSGDKPSIVEHFTPSPELERVLADDGKRDLLESVRSIRPGDVRLESVIQEEPLGLGHAVLCARELVSDDEPFAVLLPDDMIRTPGEGAIAQLVRVHQETGASVIGVEEIDSSLTDRYGIAAVEQDDDGRLRVVALVEKPAPEDAPSNLGVVGRYVLHGSIFSKLESVGKGAGGEIQLTDAIAAMLGGHEVLALPLEGVRYDCGSKLGMLEANIDYALEDDGLREGLIEHLKQILAEKG